MKNKIFAAGILGFGLVVSATIVANGAYAQTAPDSIQFPVAELGNCKDKDECKAYCDDIKHADACLAFAEKNNLMSEEELQTAKKFLEAGGKGPGGCTGKEECQNYCDNISHIDECISFAEDAGILPPEQLAEAKQVQAAIASGVKPPACRNKKECDAYCEDSSHMKECVAFGEAAGFLKGKELDDAKKMITAIESGATPPACRGKEECDAYCSDAAHIEECMTFAQAAGLMSPEEAQNSQKMIEAIKKGVKPPACKGKEECDAYCSDSAHTDECIQFSVAAGFMTEKDAEMAKKTGGKGPGGCVGKDACEAFCGNQDNQQTCMNFAKENGFDSGPGEQGREMRGDDDFNAPDGSRDREPPRGGPGGCQSQEECSAYCSDHQEECQKFGAQRSEGQRGPMNPQEERQPPREWSGPENYPNQPPPDRPYDESGNYPPRPASGEQYSPGEFPNQGPPPEGAMGAYPNQPPQYAPGSEPMMPPPPEGEREAPPPPPPPSGEAAPAVEPSAPIEPTAPQSSNFDLRSALASVWYALTR